MEFAPLLLYIQHGFAPAPRSVIAGQRVIWINAEPDVHHVIADDGSFDSGPIEPGGSFSREFKDPGKFGYHCSCDPEMARMLVVERPQSLMRQP
jgi:plastocyanin